MGKKRTMSERWVKWCLLLSHNENEAKQKSNSTVKTFEYDFGFYICEEETCITKIIVEYIAQKKYAESLFGQWLVIGTTISG